MKTTRSLFVLSLVATLPQPLRRHIVLPKLQIKQFRKRHIVLKKPSRWFSRGRVRVSRSKAVRSLSVCTTEEDLGDLEEVEIDAP